MSVLILKHALDAMTDEGEATLPVLGDAVLTAEWFDPRVVPLMWPRKKPPPHGYASQKARVSAKIKRAEEKTGYPMIFAALASAPTPAWARAIAAVLIFGGWRKRRWALIDAMQRVLPYSAIRVTFGGGTVRGVESIAWEPSSAWGGDVR
jgi:hypothetical protein